jgi:hypothetical protein
MSYKLNELLLLSKKKINNKKRSRGQKSISVVRGGYSSNFSKLTLLFHFDPQNFF